MASQQADKPAAGKDDKKSAPKLGSDNWLSAHYDPVASIYTFTQCMVLCNVTGDAENRLVIADLGSTSYDMKLKVFKGTSMVLENTIIDLPTGIIGFYLDQHEPRTPAIAVASGPFIYIYKNMKPYFKFTLPSLDINATEEDAWNGAKNDLMDHRALKSALERIKNDGVTLTPRSMKFIQLDADKTDDFFHLYRHSPLKRQTVITCTGTMKKTHPEPEAISCPVLGTESQQIYILDPEAFTILCRLELPSVPAFMIVSGIYDVDFRLVVACRDGVIYQLKRGQKQVTAGIDLHTQPVGLVRLDKHIGVGCMDESLRCFSTKGRLLWRVNVGAPITTVAPLSVPSRGLEAVLVGLSDSTVRIYRGKFLVDTIVTEDVVTGIQFGLYGREDNTLIMSTKCGGMLIKILKRSAKFEDSTTKGGPPEAQFSRLNVPKKTKLFVDQTLRERENAVSIHRQFMQDLYRCRLSTAREYAEALETRMNPVSTNPAEPLKLSAQIQGIGPVFLLNISLQNTSLGNASQDLFITFAYDTSLYSVEYGYIAAPYLVPGVTYNYTNYVRCLNDKGVADSIKIFVVRKGKEIPFITGVVHMPVSESVLVV